MKAQELRIGNWINEFGQKNVIVDRIEAEVWLDDDVCTDLINSQVPSDFDPIPLSPEILEKAGFRPEGDGFGIIIHKSIAPIPEYGEWLLAEQIEAGFKIFLGVKMLIVAKYLHQLQNLYFCLTDEELTFKELP